MGVQRFFGEFDLSRKMLRIESPNVIHQLRDVLRLGTNDVILVADGKGREGTAKIVRIAPHFIDVEIQGVETRHTEPGVAVTLYCSVLKNDNFELIIQKAVEIGVKEIVPLHALRTVKYGLRMDRLESIIREAAEQSGRAIIPKLQEPKAFIEAVGLAREDQVNVVFDPTGALFAVKSWPSRPERMSIWIGPEGGWDTKELDAASAKKFIIATLGPLTLRGETAAIVAAFLACHADEL